MNRQSGKVLNVFENSLDSGGPIIQYDSQPKDNDNEHWSWIGNEERPEEARRLKAKSSGLVLDIDDSGSVIQRCANEKTKSQLWQIIEIPENESP